MADQDDRKRREQTTRNEPIPDMDSEGGGPVTPGRAGQGMGVPTGDYTDAPANSAGGPETTVTVGEDTGQRRDLPDQHAAPPTPRDNADKRPRNRKEGKPG
ncbi:MAG TPA: hypothetical protein VD978_07465 [Azospirillum sp.]|nr:hypothetical protein [Azospirillum sp.]